MNISTKFCLPKHTIGAEQLVESIFKMQLWRLALHRLQLDGDMIARVEIFAQSQLAKVAASNLSANLQDIKQHEWMGNEENVP